MATTISHGPADTIALGRAWGSVASAGTVFALSGDLGTGKTQLVKGLAAGLGCPEAVSSPTFVLVHEYGGSRLLLFHLDLYRLETPGDIAAAGLEDYLIEPAGVTVVEWAERWFGPWSGQPLPDPVPAPSGSPDAPRVYRVLIETLGEGERRILHPDLPSHGHPGA